MRDNFNPLKHLFFMYLLQVRVSVLSSSSPISNISIPVFYFCFLLPVSVSLALLDCCLLIQRSNFNITGVQINGKSSYQIALRSSVFFLLSHFTSLSHTSRVHVSLLDLFLPPFFIIFFPTPSSAHHFLLSSLTSALSHSVSGSEHQPHFLCYPCFLGYYQIVCHNK